jgi:hypothetical protein
MRTLVIAVALLLAACSPAAPAADSPGAVVQEALEKLAAKDIEGLRTLACAGQEDRIRDQLGVPDVASGAGAGLLPGVDTQALLDAIALDVSDVTFGDPQVDGDVANVPVTGSVKVTFDAVQIRPIMKQLLEERGTPMSDEQLDMLLKSLTAYGQDVPIEQTIRLVRENGAWKVCQETVEVPAAS